MSMDPEVILFLPADRNGKMCRRHLYAMPVYYDHHYRCYNYSNVILVFYPRECEEVFAFKTKNQSSHSPTCT